VTPLLIVRNISYAPKKYLFLNKNCMKILIEFEIASTSLEILQTQHCSTTTGCYAHIDMHACMQMMQVMQHSRQK
jgi:hypothetical protein